jgi:hypothetical protein
MQTNQNPTAPLPKNQINQKHLKPQNHLRLTRTPHHPAIAPLTDPSQFGSIFNIMPVSEKNLKNVQNSSLQTQKGDYYVKKIRREYCDFIKIITIL